MLSLILLLNGLAASVALAGPDDPPPIAGIALTPHKEVPERGVTFDPMIDEIAATGASHLSMVVQWSQKDVFAERIGPHDTETQKDEVVRRLIRKARAKGLKIIVFPILWVERRAMGQWRGTLAPRDRDRWWAAYERFILHYARLAAEEGAEIYSVGSELGAMEHERGRWAALIGKVRGIFKGQLLYSANWDHYEAVTFWPLVDLVGLTAYYELTEKEQPTEAELVRAWADIRNRLVAWQGSVGKPLVLTEVGYPSQIGAARHPWDYTQGRTIDLEGQRRAYAAFIAAWSGEPALGGVIFWNWFGLKGAESGGYTPRGKPAERELTRWYSRPR